MKKPLSTFGVTLNNWQNVLKESLIISAIFFAIGLIILLIIANNSGKALSEFIKFDMLEQPLILGSYAIHSFLQELIARGIILGALLSMFRDYSKWFALLISALLFGFLHTHLGLSAIVMTFFIGLFFSWMYLRHHNLIGVTVAHIILGWSAFLFGIL